MAAEATAEHASPGRPSLQEPLDRGLDGRRRHVVEVAEAGVRVVEQPSERREVAASQSLDRRIDPRVLADNVFRALANRAR